MIELFKDSIDEKVISRNKLSLESDSIVMKSSRLLKFVRADKKFKLGRKFENYKNAIYGNFLESLCHIGVFQRYEKNFQEACNKEIVRLLDEYESKYNLIAEDYIQVKQRFVLEEK